MNRPTNLAPAVAMGLTRPQWLVWLCREGGMTAQQTAYSLNISVATVTWRRKQCVDAGHPLTWRK